MCTATWRITENDGYELYFNRDEARTRLPALPPSLHIFNGVSYVAPADGDHGGTWIGVNECGVSLCVLNLYGPAVLPHRDTSGSRGILLGSLLDVRRLSELAPRLGRAALKELNPFLLLGLAPRAAPLAFRWDGQNLAMNELGAGDLPVTSSAVTPERVARHRRKVFLSMVGDVPPTSEILSAFHRGASEKDRSLSVCMNRPNACTVSHCHLRVDSQRVLFEYYRVQAATAEFLGPVSFELLRQRDVIPSHIRSASQL